jgi:hypothetical protein
MVISPKRAKAALKSLVKDVLEANVVVKADFRFSGLV